MRTRLAAIVLMTAAAGLTACGGSSGSSDSANAPEPTQGTAASSAPSTAGGGTALTIQGFAYAPTPLTVAPGAVIAVTNKDSKAHTVTSDPAGAFDVQGIQQGTPVTFTAPTKPGTYTIFCSYHAQMKGTLVVSG
jgi:plastocyanin